MIISLALALWSASAGVSNLITAISTAYDEEEQRGFVKKRALSLAMTLGAVILLLVVLGLVAVLPIVLQIFTVARCASCWRSPRVLLIAVVVALALAVLYRVAPDRDAPKFRWVSVGAVVATLLWLLASIGFSIYVANFGSYAKTYGAWPASSFCCSGSGSPRTRSCSGRRSTPSPNSRPPRTVPVARSARLGSAVRSRPIPFPTGAGSELQRTNRLPGAIPGAGTR